MRFDSLRSNAVTYPTVSRTLREITGSSETRSRTGRGYGSIKAMSIPLLASRMAIHALRFHMSMVTTRLVTRSVTPTPTTSTSR